MLRRVLFKHLWWVRLTLLDLCLKDPFWCPWKFKKRLPSIYQIWDNEVVVNCEEVLISHSNLFCVSVHVWNFYIPLPHHFFRRKEKKNFKTHYNLVFPQRSFCYLFSGTCLNMNNPFNTIWQTSLLCLEVNVQVGTIFSSWNQALSTFILMTSTSSFMKTFIHNYEPSFWR